MAANDNLVKFLKENVVYLNENFDTIEKAILREYRLVSGDVIIHFYIGEEIQRISVSNGLSGTALYSLEIAALDEPLKNKINALLNKIKNA